MEGCKGVGVKKMVQICAVIQDGSDLNVDRVAAILLRFLILLSI